MTQAALKSTPPPADKPSLSVVPAPLREFVLRVDGEYGVVVEAQSIEDAKAVVEADEWPDRLSAHLYDVCDPDNQMDFTVG